MQSAIDPALEWKLTLYPQRLDGATIQYLRDVFPRDHRPEIGQYVALSLAANVATTLAVWVGIKTAEKALDGLLGKVWEWMREMLAILDRSHDADARRLTLAMLALNTRIYIARELFSDPDASQRFIAAFAEVRRLECFRDAALVLMSWQNDSQSWVATIWPKHMSETGEQFLYDSSTKKLTSFKS